MVGHFDAQLIKKQFNIPENIVPVAVLPIGYPSSDVKPASNHFKRYDIEKTVFYNNFNDLEVKNEDK